MNFKEIMYISALAGFLNTGCAALPNLKNPQVRAQYEGTYKGVVDGNKVSYKISKEGCVALVDFGENVISHIIDKDCDNTADFLNMRPREYLLQLGKTKAVDDVLEYIQRHLVKPEYKVEQI
jgi:hypothetical protein